MILNPVNAGQPLHVSEVHLIDNPECKEVRVFTLYALLLAESRKGVGLFITNSLFKLC